MTEPQNLGSSFMDNHPSQHPEGYVKFQTYLHEAKGSTEQLQWARKMTSWLYGLVDLYKRRFGGRIETTAGNNRELRAAIEASIGKKPSEAMRISFKFQKTRKEMLFPPEFRTNELLQAWDELKKKPEYRHLFGEEQELIAELNPTQRKRYDAMQRNLDESHKIANKLGISLPADRNKWRTDENYRILEARYLFRKPIDAEGGTTVAQMNDLAAFFKALKDAGGDVEKLPEELQLKRFNIDILKGTPIALAYAHRRMGEPLAHDYQKLAKKNGWPSFQTLTERFHDPSSVMQSAWDFFPREEKTFTVSEFLLKEGKMKKEEVEALEKGKQYKIPKEAKLKPGEVEAIETLKKLPDKERLKKIQDGLEQARLDAIWREATLHGTKNIYDILMGIIIPMAGSRLHVNSHEIKPFDGFEGLHEIFPPHERKKMLKLEREGRHQEVLRELRKHQELSVDESTQFTIESALYHAARNFAKHDLHEAQGFEPRKIVELSRPYAEINMGYHTPEAWLSGLHTFGRQLGLGPAELSQIQGMIHHAFPPQWAAQNAPGGGHGETEPLGKATAPHTSGGAAHGGHDEPMGP